MKCIKNPTLYKSAVKNFIVANWTAHSLLLRPVYITTCILVIVNFCNQCFYIICDFVKPL